MDKEKYKNYIEFYKYNIGEFIEDMFGIELPLYQKIILKYINNNSIRGKRSRVPILFSESHYDKEYVDKFLNKYIDDSK